MIIESVVSSGMCISRSCSIGNLTLKTLYLKKSFIQG